MQECGAEKTIKIISGKWTSMVLYQLINGKKRFGELEKALIGISPKTLSSRLRMLEEKHIITKTIFKETPLHIEYNLTEKGKNLKKLFNAMEHWGDTI